MAIVDLTYNPKVKRSQKLELYRTLSSTPLSIKPMKSSEWLKCCCGMTASWWSIDHSYVSMRDACEIWLSPSHQPRCQHHCPSGPWLYCCLYICTHALRGHKSNHSISFSWVSFDNLIIHRVYRSNKGNANLIVRENSNIFQLAGLVQSKVAENCRL